jgi:hypothetical protein
MSLWSLVLQSASPALDQRGQFRVEGKGAGFATLGRREPNFGTGNRLPGEVEQLPAPPAGVFIAKAFSLGLCAP